MSVTLPKQRQFFCGDLITIKNVKLSYYLTIYIDYETLNELKFLRKKLYNILIDRLGSQKEWNWRKTDQGAIVNLRDESSVSYLILLFGAK